MRILIIMGGFFPGKKYGGPPVSIANFCSLMIGHICYIITQNHDLYENEPYNNISDGWNDVGNSKVLYVSTSKFNIKTFNNVIQEIKPDVIYLQGLFQKCIIPSLKLAKKHKIRVLLAPRGELCKGAFSSKKIKKVLYLTFLKISKLLKNINYQSTSIEESEAISRLLKVNVENIFFLDNIPSIPPSTIVHSEKKTGLISLVFLSRIHKKKNLLFAINCLKQLDFPVLFDLYGPIEDAEYWKKCKDAIKELPKNINVKYCGLIDHANVHNVFASYDAMFFPTLSENYGHVIAESLSVGTPVIISDQTPWKIDEKNGIFAYPLLDKESYCGAISHIQKLSSSEFSELSKNCKEKFLSENKLVEKAFMYVKALGGDK